MSTNKIIAIVASSVLVLIASQAIKTATYNEVVEICVEQGGGHECLL